MSSCHSDCRCHFGGGVDVSFITPNLAVGGMIHETEVSALRSLGITHIINVNWPDRPEHPVVVQSFAHLGLAMLDDAQPKPAWWFQAGIDFASHLGPTDTLLVHCSAGINRSPAMAYAILRARGHDDAEQRIRAARNQTGGGTFAVYCASADVLFA